MADPYADGVYRWWHLSSPSPELIESATDGWLGEPGDVLDIGCGLGTELAYLAASGWRTVGIDLSEAALGQAQTMHDDVPFVLANALEVHRVLRPDARLPLRACLASRGVRNLVTEAGLTATFAGWAMDRLARGDLSSDTRTMPALVARLRRG